MAWSTSEIADMASTTVNTVRHYHRLGLLDEPERNTNGYEQYEVGHLVQLLQIRRLAGLGLPLGLIEEVNADSQSRQRVLRELDVELVECIERLQHARADLRCIVEIDETLHRLGAQIQRLPPDAEETSRERLAPVLAENLREYPWLLNQSEHLSRGETVARQTLSEAIAQFYNPAQRDVLLRAGLVACELLGVRVDAR